MLPVCLIPQLLASLDKLKGHGHFRFILTSRPEDDIHKAFDSKSWILPRNLTAIDEASTDDDIRQYVESELSNERALIQRWPDKPWVDIIVERAEHLFQWAFVACNFIKGTGEAGVLPLFLIPQYILMFISMTILNAYSLSILF